MGIIGCKLDFNYNQNENQEEVKTDENILKKMYIDYNNSRNQEQYKINNNYDSKKYGSEKHDAIQSGYAQFEKNLKMNKNNFKSKNNKGKKTFGLKKSKGEIENNSDELIIITPNKTNNNHYFENCNNEITDEYTIKNETGVYNNDNTDIKIKTNSENETKEDIKRIKKNSNIIILNDENNNKEMNNKKYNNIKTQKKTRNNSYINDKKKQIPKNNKLNSKSFVAKRKIITKKLDLNNPKNNNIVNDINKVIKKEENINKIKSIPENKKNNNNNVIKSYINRYNNKSVKNNNLNKTYKNKNNNNNINPLYNSFVLINSLNKNQKQQQQQTSTLENKNMQLKNILLQQLPLITKEEIIPNIERKTYQEDIIPIKGQKIPKKRNSNRKNYNQLYTEHNNYFLLKNNNEIMDKLKDIYEALYERNQLLNCQNENYKKCKSPDNMIHRRDTDFHVRNKSFSNNENYNMKNNEINNNSYFSLFNNSTNLSINFINKANKCTQSARGCENIIPYGNKNDDEKNFRYLQHKNNNLENLFSNYNNFDKKHYSGKKNTKNKTYINKVKPKLSNSKSFNSVNVLNLSDLNNNLLSQQYRDLIEVYIPQKESQTLIDTNIINNRIGSKCIFSYKKIDNYDTKIVLYDGDIFKVIDNMEEKDKEEEDNNKYKLLHRYFQITKNCFKYYNDINDAMNNNDKPLVQFDIRFIQNVEILENNFLEKYTINEKNVELVFCIYIKQNNDFFVFAHDNKKIATNIINILLFLMRYYEDKS